MSLVGFLVAQMVKNLPAMQTCVLTLGLGRSPGEKMATQFSILACRIPWTQETGSLQSMGSQRVRCDWVTITHSMLLFSHLVMSSSLQPRGLQQARSPCPSPSTGVCPSSCSLNWWCHPAISSSDTLFSFCPWSFPASGTFPVSHLCTSDNQNTGASASASVLPVNIQG